MNPFKIEGPAVISFSGGRTSAYMLRRCLDAGLDSETHVLFADTGLEREETYTFVRECAQRWDVKIEWVAYPKGRSKTPFDALLAKRKYLPGARMRFCTTELKIRRMKQYMLAQGYEHWTMVVGIRADEPARVARMRVKPPERWENAVPLADAGVTERDVLLFWKKQPFDLQLRPWEGNCTLCHLKAQAKLVAIIRERPELAEWWVKHERRTGQQFRLRGRSYKELTQIAKEQNAAGLPMPTAAELGHADIDDLGDCVCHD